MTNEISTILRVKNQDVRVVRIDGKEYISLTDLARYADNEEPRLPIRDWMRNKEVISYLGLWETLNNKEFKGGEFAPFENEAGSNTFKMSPQKWIKTTNAIGIISKSGNNGGTFAVSDIAFEFASWLSPEFKLYLIQEFQRLKKNEAYQNKIYIIRGMEVMLDSDLAKIYGYTTKDFNRQVKNNIERFDDDFRFQLTREEYINILRCKNCTLELEQGKYSKYLPYVFTEDGIYMLMTVLKEKKQYYRVKH